MLTDDIGTQPFLGPPLTSPQNLAKHRTATLVDLRRVAQRIHYVNRKGGDSVQERTQ